MDTKKIKIKAVKAVIGTVIISIILVVGYIYIALTWSYSKGDRVGYVQKFSEKGWLCKTWEGELQMLPIPGAMPERFMFTAREANVINKLQKSLGKKVTLSYEQHKGIPTNCFGETEYFVVAVTILE